jgi:hypothetical protein
MSETLESVVGAVDQKKLAQQLLGQAEEQGIELLGPGGLLNQLTENVLETALEAEMTEHVGYEEHDPAGRGTGNSRNGTRSTVLTEIGPVEFVSQNLRGRRLWAHKSPFSGAPTLAAVGPTWRSCSVDSHASR